eukprot:5305004-Pyramimonas_sp.AAC.1
MDVDELFDLEARQELPPAAEEEDGAEEVRFWANPACPRCGDASETTFHQLWACPCNVGIEGTHPELLQQAEA